MKNLNMLGYAGIFDDKAHPITHIGKVLGKVLIFARWANEVPLDVLYVPNIMGLSM